ncbi:Uncharacterised protein [Mycobacteroides abscessus subsp. abscessus]|nr:Uncharacterised protein [Mycobacteroides abscessus subsp. abscessus]
MQGDGQACACTRAAALHRALRHTEQFSGIGDRVALHIDRDDRRALLRGQP